MDLEETLAEIVAERAIERLKIEYCYAIDEKRCDDFVDLFTDDATIDYATRDTYRGREEIREFIETHVTEADRMAHTALNPRLIVDGDTAVGTWYGIVLISIDETTALFGQGKYDETYRRTTDGWKIASLATESRFSTEL